MSCCRRYFIRVKDLCLHASQIERVKPRRRWFRIRERDLHWEVQIKYRVYQWKGGDLFPFYFYFFGLAKAVALNGLSEYVASYDFVETRVRGEAEARALCADIERMVDEFNHECVR